ncbi:hypothetical protein [Streptococcus sp. S784/96/1]|uniref:hypothetical protein n=1 Tax=Streptococcus sp. S784/96/1 TaxID=2653499 RepID=UPI00138A0F0F|nr:hypothetical protein [Streptococcus sp. S784/96/1]
MLPNNGSIVIIDDQVNEACPLFTFLSRENKSFRYFNGQGSTLPDAGGVNEAIRLVFLDYNLTVATNPKLNNSTIASNLKRIIPQNNGPYYILLWTKEKVEWETESFECDLKQYLDEDFSYVLPAGVEYLDKNAYFELNPNSKEAEYIFQKDKETELRDRIFAILTRLSLLEFFVKWENQVLLTSQKLVSKTTDISDNARDLAYHLAKVNLEQSTSNLPNEKLISAAYQSLNTVYSTYLNHKVEEIQLENAEFQNLNSIDSIISNKGRINSWLNINTLDNPSHIGKVFCETGHFSDVNIINTNTASEKDFLSKVQEKLEANEQNDNYYFKEIGLEISPECDFAQNKRNFYRIIPGIFVSEELLKDTQHDLIGKLKYTVNNRGNIQWSVSKSIFVSPKIEYKDDSSNQTFNAYLILDLSQFKTVPLKDGDNDYFEVHDVLFSINNDMLQGIKNELASNIQRKGYQSI